MTELKIAVSQIEYRDGAGELLWCCPIDSILLIAEYTTNEGPYFDDYFIVFVAGEKGEARPYACSAYATGFQQVISAIEERLRCRVDLQLSRSTEWRSRVAWPVEMAGAEYLSFPGVQPESLPAKLKAKLLGPTLSYSVSQRVKDYISTKLSPSA